MFSSLDSVSRAVLQRIASTLLLGIANLIRTSSPAPPKKSDVSEERSAESNPNEPPSRRKFCPTLQGPGMQRTLFVPPRIERRVARAAVAVASAVLAPRRFVENVHYRLVTREPGTERADLPVWTTMSDEARLVSPDSVDTTALPWGPVVRTDVPGVDGAFVLTHVLTDDECDAIVAISEAMGYTPDAPVSLGRDVRCNENCVIIADDGLWKPIWRRVEKHMPRGSVLGGVPAGLNQRWRLYRYSERDVFKMHWDGSWTGSGLDERGNFVQDIFGDRESQLTFLIYLDEDYEGGETTFYVDEDEDDRVTGDSRDRGSLVSVRVPKGSVLCFFHGEHPLSLLHEGSVVTRGVKRIVRSDVLYTLPKSEDESKDESHDHDEL